MIMKKETILSGIFGAVVGDALGYVAYSQEVALYYAYPTNSYKESVLKAVKLGGDTDTHQ